MTQRTHRFLSLAALVATAACGNGAPPSPPPATAPPASSPAHPPAKPRVPPPETRARAFLERQIAFLTARDDTANGHARFLATFAPDAIVWAQNRGPTRVASLDVVGIGAIDGPGGPTRDEAIATLVAGGTDDAVWFTADVARTLGTEKSIVRVTELVVGDTAVAGSFSEPKSLEPMGELGEIPGATTHQPGPLAALVGDRDKLAAALSPDAIVVGPDKSPPGNTLSRAWPAPIVPVGGAREVTSHGVTFVQLDADHPDGDHTDRLTVLLVALPDHRVVLAQAAAM